MSAAPEEKPSLRKKLRDRAADVAPVKAPAMNITLGTAGVLSLSTVLTAWDTGSEFLFGASASESVRAQVLIATMAAIVLVVAADMFARAIASRQDRTHVVPWAKGWKATLTKPGPDESGFLVAGMRVRASSPEDVEYLLVKEGVAPSWEPAEQVQLAPPAADKPKRRRASSPAL